LNDSIPWSRLKNKRSKHCYHHHQLTNESIFYKRSKEANLLQGHGECKLATELRALNNLFAHVPPRLANGSTCNNVLSRRPCVLTLLQPSNDIK